MNKRTMKGLRSDLGITQMQMAEKLGTSISNYQKYERMESKVPLEIAIKFADLFNITDIREIRFK